MNKNQSIADSVGRIYSWIDCETGEQACDECGRCCDFESFGHKLFVTTLEMLYFWAGQGELDFPPAANGRCPYQASEGCQARQYRPSGCRIFYCRDLSRDFQQELTEQVLARLREMHEKYHAPYYYAELTDWLK